MDKTDRAITGLANLSLTDSGSAAERSLEQSPSVLAADGARRREIDATGTAGTKVACQDLEGMSPLEFFVEEIENEDVYVRLEAYRRVRLIAGALGPQMTEQKLLPLLLEHASSLKDDEILLTLAQGVGNDAFLPLVPSPAVLVPLLTRLAGAEETVVREAAVASLLKVFASLPSPVTEAFSTFQALAQGELFCPQVSAASLFPAVYQKTEGGGEGGREGGREGELRALFGTALAKNDNPMVRKAAASALREMVPALSPSLLSEWLIPLWGKLSSDDQDMVRVAAVESMLAVAQTFQSTGIDDQTLHHVLPPLRHALEDRSWKVRVSLATDYAGIARALKGEGGQRALDALHHDLLPGLVSLLQDNEAEVRIAALTHGFAPFCPLLGAPLFVQHLLPCARLLAPDTLPGVRLALSTACLDLAPFLGQDEFMEQVMPLLERFLMDATCPEVNARLHILSRLAAIGPWLPPPPSAPSSPSPSTSSLPTILLHLREDENWRLRKGAIEAFPVLAAHMSSEHRLVHFEPTLLPPLLSAFHDRVAQVRAAATLALGRVAHITGPAFVEGKIWPRVLAQYRQSRFYLMRMALLHALQSLLVKGETSASLTQEILALVLEATRDKVPNVRFTAAQVLAEVSGFLDASSLQTSVTPCLGAMAEKDADGDVRFYAALALQGKEEVSMASGEDNLSARSVAVLGGGGGGGGGGRDQGGGS